MALYRQQSLITSRKKEACAERLNDLIQEMNALEAQLQVHLRNETIHRLSRRHIG